MKRLVLTVLLDKTLEEFLGQQGVKPVDHKEIVRIYPFGGLIPEFRLMLYLMQGSTNWEN